MPCIESFWSSKLDVDAGGTSGKCVLCQGKPRTDKTACENCAIGTGLVRTEFDGEFLYECIACKPTFYSSAAVATCVLCVGRTDVLRTTCEPCPVGGLPKPDSAGLHCRCSDGFFSLSEVGSECLE